MAHKILVFVPGFGQIVTNTTFLTVCALQQHCISKNIGIAVTGMSFPDIAELRSMAMTVMYDTMPDVSHLLFIDSDMGFHPDMVTDMLMLDEGIVGSIYAQRKMPLSWAGSGTGEPTTQRRGNFMLVEGVGMGCTLIKREVVTALLAQMPHLIDTRIQLHPAGEMLRMVGTNRIIRAFEKLDLPERGLVSEDLSFCIRARECGIMTWAAIGYPISHVGPYDYRARYLDIVEQQAALAEEQQRQALAAAQVQAVAAPQPAPVGVWAVDDQVTVLQPAAEVPTLTTEVPEEMKVAAE